MIKGYIGTYDTPNTKGIYQFNLMNNLVKFSI